MEPMPQGAGIWQGSAPAGAEGANALQVPGELGRRPMLKELVVEASRALALLDADRLEELALSCQALNRDLTQTDAEARAALAREAQAAARDMAVFGKVLEGTRANLNVMNRLRELRGGPLEYSAGRYEPGEAQATQWPRSESGYGDN
jgi:hypothetical protein